MHHQQLCDTMHTNKELAFKTQNKPSRVSRLKYLKCTSNLYYFLVSVTVLESSEGTAHQIRSTCYHAQVINIPKMQKKYVLQWEKKNPFSCH